MFEKLTDKQLLWLYDWYLNGIEDYDIKDDDWLKEIESLGEILDSEIVKRFGSLETAREIQTEYYNTLGDWH